MDATKAFNKFQEETYQLCSFAQPTRPLEYFFNIGKTAFDYVKNKTSKEVKKQTNNYLCFPSSSLPIFSDALFLQYKQQNVGIKCHCSPIHIVSGHS